MSELFDQGIGPTTGELVVGPDRPQAVSVLNIIAEAARNPNVDVAKLKELLAMQREVMADEAKVLFTKALHAAQAEIPPIEKNGTITLIKDGVNKGSIPFATFEDMSRVLKPIIHKHGLEISFDTQIREGGGMNAVAILEHIAGHSRTYSISLPLDTGPGRNNLQAMGSTLSYCRRYLCEMAFNIVRKGQDDDGVLGGQNLITAAQVKQIESLLAETGSDRDKFLTFMGTTDVKSIPSKDFTKAINALQAKRSRAAQ